MKKAIFSIVVVLLVFQNWDRVQAVWNPPPDYSQLQREDVVLYATSWCGYCTKTRKFLQEKGIKYYEYDVEKSEEGRKQYEDLKGNGVPLLLVKGEVIRGFNTGKILSALE